VGDFLRIADEVADGGGRDGLRFVQLHRDRMGRVNLWIGSVGLALNIAGLSDLTMMVEEAAQRLKLRRVSPSTPPRLPAPYH
jgi:hypothetical protein